MKTLPVVLCFSLLSISLSAFGSLPPENRFTLAPPPKTKAKKTPCPKLSLFRALESRDSKCLAEALKHMRADETNAQGDTPLHVAIRAKNRVALNFLIRHGADLNQRNFAQQTPRELAEACGFRKLSDYLAELERETERLFQAVDEDDLNSARDSLARGASVSTRNSRMDTPLHRAAQSNLPEMISLLLRYGANVNARNYLGETPLHSASLRDFHESMKVLLAAGANPSALNHRRETALDFAYAHGNSTALALLGKYKARYGSRADVSVDLSGGDGEDIDASGKP